MKKKSSVLVMQLKKPQNFSVRDWKAAFSDVLRHPYPRVGLTGAVLQGPAGNLVQLGMDGNPDEPISAAEISFRARYS